MSNCRLRFTPRRNHAANFVVGSTTTAEAGAGCWWTGRGPAPACTSARATGAGTATASKGSQGVVIGGVEIENDIFMCYLHSTYTSKSDLN